MNAITSNDRASARDIAGALIQAVGRRVAGWRQAYLSRRTIVEAAAKLRGLGDRDLRDIGLHRGDIDRSVRGILL